MENKKDKNLKILIIILLIIVLLLIGTTIKMYSTIMEMNKNSDASRIEQSTNSNEEINDNSELDSKTDKDPEDEEPEVEYNIEGIYSHSEENSEKISYEFSKGKVKYEALSTAEGTYSIEGNKIKINYDSAKDPDGKVTKAYPNGKEEELVIIDNNTLESKRNVNGAIRSVRYSKDSDSTIVNENTESNLNKEDEIVGEWKYYSIQENGETISFRDVFGSGVQNNMGSMTFYKDGTFTNYLPGISSSEIEDKGKFSLNGNTITLIYSDRTEKITYYEETGTIEQEYSDYVLTLVRDEN